MRIGYSQFSEPRLHWRQWYGAGDDILPRRDYFARPGNGSQRRDCLMLKHLLRCQLQAGFVGFSDDLDSQHGISTELEEVVVHSYLLDTEQLLPDLCDCSFCLCLWRNVGRVDIGAGVCRLRSSLFIELVQLAGYGYRFVFLDDPGQISGSDNYFRPPAIEHARKSLYSFLRQHAVFRLEVRAARRIDGHPYFSPSVPNNRTGKRSSASCLRAREGVEERVRRTVINASMSAKN